VYTYEISAKGDRLQVTKVTFIYDDSNLTILETSLSSERLAPYLLLAGNERRYAIALYEWNTKVSEALYGLIQGLEVTLRNSFHRVLTAAYGREDWYEPGGVLLLQPQRDQVEEAKLRIQGDGRAVTPGRVVAELMFGFWTALVGTDYAQRLWDKDLNRAFPTAKLSRKQVAKRLSKIRFLRNRVAHHECIIGKIGHERNLQEDVEQILEAIGWICTTTALWAAQTCSFDLHYGARPLDPSAQPTLPEVAPEDPEILPATEMPVS
jgi:hypothetical protein